jgi:hypothetical protein
MALHDRQHNNRMPGHKERNGELTQTPPKPIFLRSKHLSNLTTSSYAGCEQKNHEITPFGIDLK